jgi:hypothetical protein
MLRTPVPADRNQPLHRTAPVYTGLKPTPVGSVGNQGRQTSLATLLSNSPEIIRPILENKTQTQIAPLQHHGMDIHFSCHNYG